MVVDIRGSESAASLNTSTVLAFHTIPGDLFVGFEANI